MVASASSENQGAQPAKRRGMKTSHFFCHRLGWRGVWAWAHWGLALRARHLHPQLAEAAGALPAERRLENAAHVLFPWNTSFFTAWQLSPSRGPEVPSC